MGATPVPIVVCCIGNQWWLSPKNNQYSSFYAYLQPNHYKIFIMGMLPHAAWMNMYELILNVA